MAYTDLTVAGSLSQPAINDKLAFISSRLQGLDVNGKITWSGVTQESQTANTVFAAPDGSTGTPSFRALTATDIPNLAASKITTGQLALARGGTGADLSATGGANQVLKQVTVGGTITVGTLDAASIATGKIALARGGTNADLSATGGANQFLKQTSAGAAVSVSALAVGDVPDVALTSNVALLNRDPQAFSGKQYFSNALRISIGGVSSSPYTIDGTKFLYGKTMAGALTILMPASPSSGDVYVIKDYAGNAAANNITIDGNGKNIEGAATQTIATNYGFMRLYYTGVEWQQW